MYAPSTVTVRAWLITPKKFACAPTEFGTVAFVQLVMTFQFPLASLAHC